MITLLGTGHVFDLRKRLQRELLARVPDVVCLELDPGRMQGLLARQRGSTSEAPLTYRLLAEFQGKMASEHGIAPGDEMLAAYEAAQQARVPVELIDLDAQRTFQRLWGEMGWGERARLVASGVASLVLPKRMVEDQLEQMQADYAGFFEAMAKEYPTIKRVLIDERNAHMAARLAGLHAQGKQSVVAVVGDGHVDGMRALLEAQGLVVECVRLKELRAPEQASTATWSTFVDA
jgi:pheromone shutdown protein TraB